MDAGADSNYRSVDAVFRDFKGRRVGIIKALTTGKILSFLESEIICKNRFFLF